MSSTPGDELSGNSALDHLRRALRHALDGARAYVALLAADVQQRFTRALGQAIWTIALVVLGLLGAVLFFCGLALCIERCIGVPGGGLMAVGAALVLAVAIAAVVARKGRERR